MSKLTHCTLFNFIQYSRFSAIAFPARSSILLLGLCSISVNASLMTQRVTFEASGQSMWGTGSSTQLQEDIFIGTAWGDQAFDVNGKRKSAVSKKIVDIGDKDDLASIEIETTTSGKLGLEAGFKIDSGTVNTELPFEFLLDVPDANELINNRTFSMGVIGADIQSGAFLETLSPSIEAYLDLILKADLKVDVEGCYNIIVSSGCDSLKKPKTLFDIDESVELLAVNKNRDGQIRVLDGFKPLFEAGATAKDLKERSDIEKVSIDLKPKIDLAGTPLIEVDMKIPNIVAKETLSQIKSVNSGRLNNVLSTSGSDNFLDIGVDVDQLFTNLAGLPPLGASVSADFGIGSISANADILDVTFTPSLSLSQKFDLSITDVSVDYLFDSAVSAGLSANSRTNTTRLNNVDVGQKIHVLWKDGIDIGITPIYDVNLSLTNETGLKFDTELRIDVLSGGISAEIAGAEIVDESFAPLAKLPFNTKSLNLPPLFKDTFTLGGVGDQVGNRLFFTDGDVNWRTGREGNWATASNWQNGSQPLINDVLIKTTTRTDPSKVSITSNASAKNLALIGNSHLTIHDFKKLTLSGNQLFNEGTIKLNDGSIAFDSNAKLTGNGNLYLESYSGRLRSEDTTRTLSVYGQNIEARNGGGRITDLNINLYDNATLGVSNGQLRLYNGLYRGIDNNNYAITGNAGTVVQLSNTDIRNINFSTQGTFALADVYKTRCELDGGIFGCLNETTYNHVNWRTGGDGVMSLNGFLEVINVNSDIDEKILKLSGQTDNVLINNGQIRVFQQGSLEAGIEVKNNYTFSGTGNIRLDSDDAYLKGRSTKLVNGEDHSISGRGLINNFDGNGGLINYGLINASFGAGELRFVDNTITNYGVLSATNNGVLRIEDGSWTNNGTVLANGGKVVEGAFFTKPNLTNLVASGEKLTLNGGKWQAKNGGEISLYRAGNYTKFENKADITLSGSSADININNISLDNFGSFVNHSSGVLTLNYHTFSSSNFDNYGRVNLNNGTVKGVYNRVGGLIAGYGEIEGRVFSGEDVINRGTIRAEGVGKSLTLSTHGIDGKFRNYGRVEVMDGASLRYEDLSFLGFFGGFHTFGGDGGTWAAYSDKQYTEITFYDNGVNLSADSIYVDKLDDVNLVLSGRYANFVTEGKIPCQFLFCEPETIRKNLKSTLETISSDASLSLLNGQNFIADNTISNWGTLNIEKSRFASDELINRGSINAGGVIDAEITNFGDININKGILNFSDKIDNQTNGTINVGNTYGDVLRLAGAEINDGKLSVAERGRIDGFGDLNNIELDNNGTILSNSSDNKLSLTLAGDSINNGLIGAIKGGELSLAGTQLDNALGTLLADSSTIKLEGLTIVDGNVQILGADAVLRGYGKLDNVSLKVFDGVISADVAGKRLIIDPNETAQLLKATLQAEKRGILVLQNGRFEGAGATLIIAKHGSIVELHNVEIKGGRLVTEGSGKIIDVATSYLSDLSLEAVTEVASTGHLNLAGNIVNQKRLSVLDGGEIIMNDASLSGRGVQVTTLPDNSIDISPVVYNGQIEIAKGGVLRGSGSIDNQHLINRGKILVEGERGMSIDVFGEKFDNLGEIEIGGNDGLRVLDQQMSNYGSVDVQSKLSVESTYVQHNGSTNVDGILTTDLVRIENGVLTGSGIIDANVIIGVNGEVSPGNSPGILTVLGDLDLLGTYNVEVVSDTEFDVLDVSGDVTFASTTLFNFLFDPSFNPFDGFNLNFILANNFFNFDLLTRANFNFVGLNSSLDWQLVFNSVDNLVAIAFYDASGNSTAVSEPRTLFYFMLLLMVIFNWRKKRCN